MCVHILHTHTLYIYKHILNTYNHFHLWFFLLPKARNQSARLNHLSCLQFSKSQASCDLPKQSTPPCQAAFGASRDGNVTPWMRRLSPASLTGVAGPHSKSWKESAYQVTSQEEISDSSEICQHSFLSYFFPLLHFPQWVKEANEKNPMKYKRKLEMAPRQWYHFAYGPASLLILQPDLLSIMEI